MSGGIGLSSALAITFIVLKLTGQIDWSWWWVLSPWWIGFVGAALFIIGVVVFAVAIGTVKTWREKRRQ
jgi:membrane protein YdbS with pleckstrin-like domain